MTDDFYCGEPDHKKEQFAFEEYKLVFFHNYVIDGRRSKIEDPVQVSFCFDRMNRYTMPTPVILNEAIDRMKCYLFERMKDESK